MDIIIYNCVYIYDFDIYILHFILGSFQKEGHRRLSKIRSVGDLGILRFKYIYEWFNKISMMIPFFFWGGIVRHHEVWNF